MQYEEKFARMLLSAAKPMYEVPKKSVIFKQGEMKDGYYVIVRGTVKIEQTAAKYMHKADMLPIVIRTCYDGD